MKTRMLQWYRKIWNWQVWTGPKVKWPRQSSQFGHCFTLVWALADIYHDVLRRLRRRRRRLTPAERQGVSSAPNWPRRRATPYMHYHRFEILQANAVLARALTVTSIKIITKRAKINNGTAPASSKSDARMTPFCVGRLQNKFNIW